MRTGLLIVVLATIAACSSNPSDRASEKAIAAQAGNGDGVICTEGRPTGSFLKEKRCTTAQEREAERRQQDTLMDVRNPQDSNL